MGAAGLRHPRLAYSPSQYLVFKITDDKKSIEVCHRGEKAVDGEDQAARFKEFCVC